MRVFRGRAVTATTAPGRRRTDRSTADDRAGRVVAPEPPVHRRPPVRPHLSAAA